MANPKDEPITATLDKMPEMQVTVSAKPYPVHAHDHPYSIAANRIHELEERIRRLEKDNRSLRLLAIHGIIYRLDSLRNDELAKKYPNPVRVERWSAGIRRFRAAYERIKAGL